MNDPQTQVILEKYVEIFQKTFSAKTNEERKQAETDLQTASVQDPKFLEHLLLLIFIDKSPKEIKNSASIYINTYVRNLMAKENFTDEEKQKCVEIFFEALLEPRMDTKYKKPIVNSISLILQFDSKHTLKISMYEKITKIIGENNKEKFSGCFLAIGPIITSTRQVKILDKIASNVIGLFSDAIQTIIQPLDEKLKQLGQSNVKPDEATIQEIINCIQIIEIWADMMRTFIVKFTDSEYQTDVRQLMFQLVSNQKVALTFMQIIQVVLPNQSQIQDCLISTCDIPVIDSAMNNLKSSIIQSYQQINVFMFNNRGQQQFELKNIIFFQMLSQVLPYVMGSVYNFCFKVQNNLFLVLEDSSMEKIIVENLTFLKSCGSQQEFYLVFAQNKQQLILNVLFPLMRTSESEIDQFTSNAEEFVNLALDTCDKQLSKTFKTAAAQLLEILCDNIDGTTSFVAQICLNTIKFSLNSYSNPNQPEQFNDNTNFPFLQDSWESIFIKLSTPEIRIETSLIILAVISYMVPKRMDIVLEIENCLKNNAQFFFKEGLNTNLIKSRMCLFLGYYSDTIFQKQSDNQVYSELIEYLIQCTNSDIESISFQAIDSLMNIYDEDEMSDRLKTTIVPVFQSLISLITKTKSNQFLDLIQTITQTFAIVLKNNLQSVLECVQQLVTRVKSEFEKSKNDGSTSQLFINKCWNIIRSIADNDSYIPVMANEMEVVLQPLFEALKHPKEIEFEDDILLTVTSFLKKRRSLSPAIIQLLPHFPAVVAKYENVFGHMFQTFNYVLEFGREYFEQNTVEGNQILQMILQLSFTVLNTESNKSNEADNAEGATLISIIVFKYQHLLNEEMYTAIYTNIFQRLQKQVNFSFLKGRILGIYLVGFMKDFTRMQSLLENMGQLQNVMTGLVNKCENYATNLDVKIFVLGSASMFMHDNMKQEVQQQLSVMLDFIVTLLKKQEISENKKLNKQQNNQQNNSDDDDSDDDNDYSSDDEDGFKYHDDETMQDKFTLDCLIFPDIIKTDEFECFKKIVHQIKDRSQEVLMQLVQTLSDDKQQYLRQVLSIQRVQVGENKTVARRIVKRKK